MVNKIKINPVMLSFLLITFFSAVAYLPLIPFLGFYSDDFFFSYIAHFYGIPGIIKSLVVDRPFNGYLLAINYSFLGLGDNVFLWHIYNFFIRLLGGYALFFTLLKIWPARLTIITFITLLFLLYPGFLQQTLPLGFGGWITTLTIWIFSFAFTVFALRSIKKSRYFLFTLISLSLQINAFLQLEFFIGMEIFRLLMITYVIKSKISIKTIKKTAVYWGPYLVCLVIFVAWRIFIFKSTREVTNLSWVVQTYYSNPLWIMKIPIEIVYSFLSTVILAYFIPILIRIPRIPVEFSIISLLVGMVSAIVLYLYFKIMEKSQKDKNLESLDGVKKFGATLLIVGSVSILGALLPIIVSGRFVRLFNVFDRYTTTSIIGVSFVIEGFLFFKIKPRIRNLLITYLIATSVTTHLMNGFLFANNWNQQKDIWWQLYWRTPKIQNNAMLIFDFPQVSEDTLFKDIINKVRWFRFYWVDYQIWAPGNLFFNYEDPPQNHFSGDFLEDRGISQKISNKTVETFVDRNIEYLRDFNNTIIITTPGDRSCLWVLDGERQELPDYSSEVLKSKIIYSDIDKLVKKGVIATPPAIIFGSEPAYNWCYFFQKASLARQLKDWDRLSQLTREVFQKNLKPKDVNEWLPFIEGLIISKNFSPAEDLIKNRMDSKNFMSNICQMLKRLQTAELKIYCNDQTTK